MISSISSLGLGSNGILSSDLIEKLKSADEKSLVTPIKDKITTVENKIDGVNSIAEYINTLQSNISDLVNHIGLSKKEVNNENVIVSDGVSEQDFSIKVNSLASIDMYQSNTYTSNASKVSSTPTTLSININNKNYELSIDTNTSLEDIKNKINDTTDKNLVANILNVGENEYRLIIKSSNTGDNNKISFSGDNTLINNLGLNLTENHIKNASNSSFEFNGVKISRNTNSIDDLITGVKINLTDNMKTLTNISITDNIDNLSTTLTNFTDTYNKLVSYLAENTKYDVANKTSSLFQSESSIKNIKRELSDLYSNNIDFLNKIGITNDNGTLSFNKNAINTISNSTKNKLSKDNYFNEFNNLLSKYDIDKSNSYLSTYQLNLKSQQTKLNNNLSITNEILDNRYNAMAKKFASYDSIISKYTTSFDVLNNIIKASYQSKN